MTDSKSSFGGGLAKPDDFVNYLAEVSPFHHPPFNPFLPPASRPTYLYPAPTPNYLLLWRAGSIELCLDLVASGRMGQT